MLVRKNFHASLSLSLKKAWFLRWQMRALFEKNLIGRKGKNGSMLNSVIRSVASGCIKLDLPSDKPRYPERRLLVSTPGTSERKRVNKTRGRGREKKSGEEERRAARRMKSFFRRRRWSGLWYTWGRQGSASSTVRHRHRISVKSKGADLVARKLATKFGEKAEAAGGGGGGEAQRESIRPVESRSTSFGWLASSPPSSTPSPPPRAILSSRICDHQHAKWIKFLDYTFRRPFFTRFRFLYLASRHRSQLHPPSPNGASLFLLVSFRPVPIPDCFSPPRIPSSSSLHFSFFPSAELLYLFLSFSLLEGIGIGFTIGRSCRIDTRTVSSRDSSAGRWNRKKFGGETGIWI